MKQIFTTILNPDRGKLRPDRRLASLTVIILGLLTLTTACNDEGRLPPTQEANAIAAEIVNGTEPPTSSTPAAYPGRTDPTLPPPASAYPIATPTPVAPYPAPSQTPLSTTRPTAEQTVENGDLYLPMVEEAPGTTPTATSMASATRTPTSTPTATPTIDFAAVESELNAQGQDLAYSKIGFHVTFLEEKGMLDEWMQTLDQAGVPFYLKTVDNAEPLYKAQQLMKSSAVPHTLVFRATGGVPNYDLPPQEAAEEHWILHRDKFPPELDPNLVWLETVNEVDKNRSEWLAEFALETARLAMADGFRWAAFGWAPGEPEAQDWQSPAMLEFLRLAGENPDRLAIAVHEGSLSPTDIKELYPYRLGRFLQLFEICDRHDIPRPTVLITEWGWAYDDIPAVEKAMEDIRWAAALYAPFPEVKGAAIWNLGTGCCFGTVSQQVRQLIEPLRRFNLGTYYAIPQPPARAPTDPTLYE